MLLFECAHANARMHDFAPQIDLFWQAARRDMQRDSASVSRRLVAEVRPAPLARPPLREREVPARDQNKRTSVLGATEV